METRLNDSLLVHENGKRSTYRLPSHRRAKALSSVVNFSQGDRCKFVGVPGMTALGLALIGIEGRITSSSVTRVRGKMVPVYSFEADNGEKYCFLGRALERMPDTTQLKRLGTWEKIKQMTGYLPPTLRTPSTESE